MFSMSWMLVRCGPHLSQGKLYLNGSEVTIGRAVSNTYPLSSTFISRRHAVFTFNGEEGKWLLKDNQSANGIFINGFRAEAQLHHPLIEGDEIGFGAPPSAQCSDDVFIYKLTFEVKQEKEDDPIPSGAQGCLPSTSLSGPTTSDLPLPRIPTNQTVAETLGPPKPLDTTAKMPPVSPSPLQTTCAISVESAARLLKDAKISDAVAKVEDIVRSSGLVFPMTALSTSPKRPPKEPVRIAELRSEESARVEKIKAEKLPANLPTPANNSMVVPQAVQISVPKIPKAAPYVATPVVAQSEPGTAPGAKASEVGLGYPKTGTRVDANDATKKVETVQIKKETPTAIARIVICDSEDEEETAADTYDSADLKRELVCKIEKADRESGRSSEDEDDEDVQYVDTGYSQEHEVYIISDDEEYFSTSLTPSVPGHRAETLRGEDDDCASDITEYVPHSPAASDICDEFNTEVAKPSIVDLDKPGPSGFQNFNDAAADSRSDISDDVDELEDQLPDAGGPKGDHLDEEDYFPELSQNFFDGDDSSDELRGKEEDCEVDNDTNDEPRGKDEDGEVDNDTNDESRGKDEDGEVDNDTNDEPRGKEEDGEVDNDTSDEPDEQQVRKAAENGFLQPSYPAAVQKPPRPLRTTLLTEPQPLDVWVRRDRRHVDKGGRTNFEEPPKQREPQPTAKKQAVIISARPQRKGQRGSSGKRCSTKESVLKQFQNRIRVPGGGSDKRFTDKDKNNDRNSPPAKRRKEATPGKKTEAAKKPTEKDKNGKVSPDNLMVEVDMFAKENESGKDENRDREKRKKKSNTVARFPSRQVGLTKSMDNIGNVAKRRLSDPQKKAQDAKRAKATDDTETPNVQVVSTSKSESTGTQKGFAVRACAWPEPVEDNILPDVKIEKPKEENGKDSGNKRRVSFASDDRRNDKGKLQRKPLPTKQRKNGADDKLAQVVAFNGMNDVFYTILYWNINWVHERKRNGNKMPPILGHVNVEAKSAIANYENFADYCQVFTRLLLYETWETLCNAVRERKTQPPTCNFAPYAALPGKSAEMLNLLCHVVVPREDENFIHIQEGQLVNFDLALEEKDGNDKRKASKKYGFISEVQELKDHELDGVTPVLTRKAEVSPRWKYLTVKLMTRFRPREGKIDMNQKSKMEVIVNIKGCLRNFEAVFKLARSPLLKNILSPQIKAFKLSDQEVSAHKNYNALQNVAIKKVPLACYNPRDVPKICVIQGPPGTGKTKVVAQIVIDLLFGKLAATHPTLRPKILLCAPSNAAVDEDIGRILRITRNMARDKKYVNILRIGPEESIGASAKHLSIHAHMETEKRRMIETLTRDLEKKEEEFNNFEKVLDGMDQAAEVDMQLDKFENERTLKQMKLDLQNAKCNRMRVEDGNRIRRAAYMNADVIASTLDSIYSRTLFRIYEKRDDSTLPPLVCIIDEAAQCMEPTALIPLMYPVNKLVLVGDHQQLPATVQSPVASECNLKQSLFERLIKCFHFREDNPCVMLTRQYRMHPEICSFPSKRFYEDKLECDKSLVNSYAKCPFVPYMFFDVTDGEEKRGESKGEICNLAEAKVVCEICKVLLRPDRFPLNIGVITFYKFQKNTILRMLKESFPHSADKIDVNTVDGFQGKEKDVIILSAVRAKSKLGFLEDPKRLNVALTRAKCCFYICGNAATLQRHELWEALISDARERRKIENVTKDKNMEYLEQFLLKVG